MNRPYEYRGRVVPGVYQRCRTNCPLDECTTHKWAYTVELPAGPGGKRRQPTKGGYATGKAAAHARADVLKAHRDGVLPVDGKVTVEQWLTRWLAGKTDPAGEHEPLRAGTATSYEAHIRLYLVPYLGARRLAELRPTHVAEMLTAIRKEREVAIAEAVATNKRYAAEAEKTNAKRQADGLTRMVAPKRCAVPRPFGRATATRVRATLSSALADAVAEGLVVRNVAAQTRQRKARTAPARPQVKVWQPDEVGRFLDALEAEGERLYSLIALAVFAGLRRGELLGLKWSKVDLRRGRLTVDWQRTANGYQVVEGPTKTDESEATIDLGPAAVAVLKAWRKAQIEERLAWGSAYQDGDYVFTRENGEPWHPDFITKRVIRLRRRHGLPEGTSLHTTRHTSASLQLASGTDIAIVSKRLRHSSIGITSDSYGHLIGKAGARAAKAAESLVPRRKSA